MWKIFKKKEASQPAQKKEEPEKSAVKEKAAPRPLETAVEKGAGKGMAEKILLRPIITEKSSIMGALNTYAFVVSPGANKISAGRAFAEIYGVRPEKVMISRSKPKSRNFRKRRGTVSGFKKALIKLPKGAKVDIFAGV